MIPSIFIELIPTSTDVEQPALETPVYSDKQLKNNL